MSADKPARAKPRNIPDGAYLDRLLSFADGTRPLPRCESRREIRAGEVRFGILAEGTGRRLYEWWMFLQATQKMLADKWQKLLPGVPLQNILDANLSDYESKLLGDDGDYDAFWAEMTQVGSEVKLIESLLQETLHDCFPEARKMDSSRLEVCRDWEVIAVL